MKHILLTALLLLAVVSGASAYENKDRGSSDMMVEVRGMTVQIVPPFSLKERARGVKGQFPANGCSYKIEWGDGLSDPQPYFPAETHCKSYLWHEYARPGVYVIRISAFGYDPKGQRVLKETRRMQVYVQ